MFLIESNNAPQSTSLSESIDVQVSQPKHSARSANANTHYQFDEMAKLRALFLGLIRQKRWIYFLNDEIKLRAAHLPVLQVKLKEHHCQFESLQRIILSGHCSAVVVEKNKLSEAQFEYVQNLSHRNKVQVILLENIRDNETLH